MRIITLSLMVSLLIFKLYGSPFFESGNEPWGVERELITLTEQHHHKRYEQSPTEKEEKEKSKLTLGQQSCRAMIRFFQLYISPIDGPRSSFYPTSSQYALEAIQKYGVLKGIAMGCERLLRENHDVWFYELTDKYGPLRKIDPVR